MVQTVHFMFYFTTRKKIISTYWEVIAVRKLCACLFLLVKSLFSLDLRWFFACLKNRYKLLFLLLKMCAWKRLFRQKKKKNHYRKLLLCWKVSRKKSSYSDFSTHLLPNEYVLPFPFHLPFTRSRGAHGEAGGCGLSLICAGAGDTPNGIMQAGEAASGSEHQWRNCWRGILDLLGCLLAQSRVSLSLSFFQHKMGGENHTFPLCFAKGLMHVPVSCRL